MYISGNDLEIKCTLDHKEQSNLVIYYFNNLWPNMVIEFFQNEEEVDDKIRFFIYQDYKSMVSWEEDGRTKRNFDKMIQFVSDDGCFWIVHEGNDSFEQLKNK